MWNSTLFREKESENERKYKNMINSFHIIRKGECITENAIYLKYELIWSYDHNYGMEPLTCCAGLARGECWLVKCRCRRVSPSGIISSRTRQRKYCLFISTSPLHRYWDVHLASHSLSKWMDLHEQLKKVIEWKKFDYNFCFLFPVCRHWK